MQSCLIVTTKTPETNIKQYLGITSTFVQIFTSNDIINNSHKVYIFFKVLNYKTKTEYFRDLHIDNGKFYFQCDSEDLSEEIYLFDPSNNLLKEKSHNKLESILDNLFIGGYTLISEGPLFLIRANPHDIQNAQFFFKSIYSSFFVESKVEKIPIVVIEGLTSGHLDLFKQANTQFFSQIIFQQIIVYNDIFFGVLKTNNDVSLAIQSLNGAKIMDRKLSVKHIEYPLIISPSATPIHFIPPTVTVKAPIQQTDKPSIPRKVPISQVKTTTKKSRSKSQANILIDKEHYYVETLSRRTYDSSPSITLHVNNNVYLFNAPEMIERQILERYGAKGCEFKQIFITSLFPDSLGGLITYTKQQFEKKPISFGLTGPPNLKDALLTDKRYVKMEDDYFDIPVTESYEDDKIKVTPIVLSKSVSFEVSIKAGGFFPVFDVRSLDDLKDIHIDCDQISYGIHFTSSDIEYSPYMSGSLRQYSSRLYCNKNNIYMNSGVFSRPNKAAFYEKRTNVYLQKLASGKTEAPPYIFGPPSHEPDIEEFTPKLPTFRKFCVTFLGTKTGKYVVPDLNYSGYLIHTNYGFIVLDPSESYVHELRRKYGTENAKYILKNIECIWISHHHCDHMFGLPALLYERSKVTEKIIPLGASPPLIEDIRRIEKLYGDFHITYHDREDPIDINANLFLESVDVFHTDYSKACRLTINNVNKIYTIVFSGDHGFNCEEFIETFNNCDILMHEAIFPNESLHKIKEAVAIQHCSTQQAIEISKRMNPRLIILTHTSMRYKETDLLKCPENNTIFAFDYMEFVFENRNEILRKLYS
ncbi:hypothetical protein TRFO_18248 [Tritrichomonas foetus]|uniref:ribonuclease Z n=1 Tax=Tritrichomonas foetus TaxID=1144522 RepID=A0A1J4KQV7_9EUKA|nr:hypothetical protein TRFO_18248 [Tritrichomonas foetus]|eukprot:OHT12054.1 hypothetical protein TRFO_18248 [Tritrichomonas foetus]